MVESHVNGRRAGSPDGLHRVVEPAGVLPQQAWKLDADSPLWPDEVRVDVRRLNLDAASYRQLREQHGGGRALRPAPVRGLRWFPQPDARSGSREG